MEKSDLENIFKLKKLKTLKLNTKHIFVTDKDIEDLNFPPLLETIHLGKTKIVGSSLNKLSELKYLMELHIENQIDLSKLNDLLKFDVKLYVKGEIQNEDKKEIVYPKIIIENKDELTLASQLEELKKELDFQKQSVNNLEMKIIEFEKRLNANSIANKFVDRGR